MEDSSSDADHFVASQKFPPIWWQTRSHYGAHMNPYSHREAFVSRKLPLNTPASICTLIFSYTCLYLPRLFFLQGFDNSDFVNISHRTLYSSWQHFT